MQYKLYVTLRNTRSKNLDLNFLEFVTVVAILQRINQFALSPGKG